MNMLTKTAFNRGMSTFVFVFYRQVVAAVLLTLLAIIFTRFPINLNLQSVVINYTSATLASAAQNLMSLFTFLLSVFIR
ncbi:WAT1-related protein [Dendrobium catenatum]|uniref:WAT1-related protein n=1 Tax=Dendrobium catenatum TaxID=906689 RepID=A0A2I0W652_9ASPA|nr:WAT1-related protein [Dendrobium catenatum]